MGRLRLLGTFLSLVVLAQVAAVVADGSPTSEIDERAATTTTTLDTLPSPTTTIDPARVAARDEAAQHPLVGAHYHLWYPSNFDQGFLRGRLTPPQQPSQGRYRSDDPGVAERQIVEATEAGIDFFTLDWWPSRAEQNANAAAGFLQADNLTDIDFATFYEVWDLGFDESTGKTFMDQPKIDRFVADMESFADQFFDNPSYLRIDGRPVVILYLSRTMTGDVAGAIAQARQRLADRGTDVYFIGDEVFWDAPDPDAIRLYDAITAYNLYESTRLDHGGFAADTTLVADYLDRYRQHGAAVGGEVPIIPSVIPGYNDRGVRPSLANYVIPRQWAPEQPPGSLLRELIDRIARPLIDDRVPMFFVTSWNEWNEDTAIEPLAPATPSSADGDVPGLYSGGFSYEGGDTQVRALRDEVIAVSGRVTDDDGRPVAGIWVEAIRADGSVAAADVTDSAGQYDLSRWSLGPGVVDVGVGPDLMSVAVDPERTSTLDLVSDLECNGPATVADDRTSVWCAAS